MSSQAGKWREDQILIVCPGSQTTMAQLGCGELTPPTHRFPTRMFRDEASDGWHPFRTHRHKKEKAAANGGAAAVDNATTKRGEDEYEWVEDQDSAEGAVYPIRGGRIVNMGAFLAFLDYAHSKLTTTYHNTPIMLMASPQWTRPDCEAITRYIFEKTKTPALCLIHSAVATQYGLKWPNMTVVDVGFEKVDVTCIFDSRVVSHRDVGYPGGIGGGGGGGGDSGTEHREISGGEAFTQNLLALLKKQDFTYDMAEQLKRSNICEVLPYFPEDARLMELPQESSSGVAPASVPAPSAVVEEASRPAEPPRQTAPGGGGDDAAAADEDDEDGMDGEGKGGDEDGVLDVANIVTSGNTREFLARKEKEKEQQKGKQKKTGKGQDGGDAAARPLRLPNSKRTRNVFHYEEVVEEDVPLPKPDVAKEKDQAMEDAGSSAAAPAVAPAASATTEGAETAAAKGEQPPATGESSSAEKPPTNGAAPAASGETVKSEPPSFFPSAEPPPPAPPAAPVQPEASETGRRIKRIRRDVEVGLERFTFAERSQIDRIVTTIYRTIQGIEDMYMRPSCWESIVFVGNGCRVRGLKENIVQTLNARHLVSPSTATIFTSELPSNLATPSGTGSQTPTGSFTALPHQLPTSSSVNPLLQAATKASMSGVPGGVASGAATGAPGSTAGDMGGHSHHFHAQTPTTIKLAPLPMYLSEWSQNGFEEAMFLGAQVAARLAFCVHNLDVQGSESQRLMSLNRVDYNDLGPKGIRTHSMLG